MYRGLETRKILFSFFWHKYEHPKMNSEGEEVEKKLLMN